MPPVISFFVLGFSVSLVHIRARKINGTLEICQKFQVLYFYIAHDKQGHILECCNDYFAMLHRKRKKVPIATLFSFFAYRSLTTMVIQALNVKKMFEW